MMGRNILEEKGVNLCEILLLQVPCPFPQSNNLAGACNPIKTQYLGSSQLKEKHAMLMSSKLNVSPQYGHMILIDG